MLNGKQYKSHVTKPYLTNERKRDQRNRDKLLGIELRKIVTDHMSIARANLFIEAILRRHASSLLDYEQKPWVSISGWGDDPREWEVSVITPEDRKLREIMERPIPEELRCTCPSMWCQRCATYEARERWGSQLISEIKDLEKRSEVIKRSLGVPTRIVGGTKHSPRIKDLLKD